MRKMILTILIIGVCFSCQLFGEGSRDMNSEIQWVDVHGAGCQRSDPKSGDPADYAEGHGPQGDSIRINNMVRAVRSVSSADLPYSIVDTGQTTRFDNERETAVSTTFVGQDADYSGLTPSYKDNGDGTVTDLNTGLMWQASPGAKMSWSEAAAAVESFTLGGYSDWRIPTIKELYSLILFSGRDISPTATSANTPFIDTGYFDFSYGDTNAGERIIDAQYISSTKYVSTTMNGDETVFGVNFADGRIKGYPMRMGPSEKRFFVIFVRGNTEYGKNSFVDNGDGTVSDLATGLMWLQNDASGMNWEEALAWAENVNTGGYTDWRLPNAKELQSIVDYSRSPDTTNSPAIDPVFTAAGITNEAGTADYGYYWTSTTHANSSPTGGGSAAYVSFGRAMGNIANMEGPGGKGMQGPPSRRHTRR